MTERNFWLTFVILLAAQILLCECLHLSALISVWFLPMMILCIPIKHSTPFLLAIAFFSGLAVDLVTGGIAGLTAIALLPAALLRNPVVSLVFGSEIFSRGENLSIKRQGALKMALAIFILTALFLIILVFADSAGTRPFWFNFSRILLSLAIDTVVSVLLVNTFSPENLQRWK